MAAEDQKKENGTADVSMTDANAPKPDPKKDLLKNGKKPDDADDELSEEDRALKENLELLVTRAVDKDVGVQKLALETIRSEIRSAPIYGVMNMCAILRAKSAVSLMSFWRSQIR